jgi:hypothetical protein
MRSSTTAKNHTPAKQENILLALDVGGYKPFAYKPFAYKTPKMAK